MADISGNPLVPSRKQNDVAAQERQADALPPVYGVGFAVSHAEMQFDRGKLVGREGDGLFGRQAF